MTDTISTSTVQPNEANVLEYLDPTVLVIEPNFRTEGLALNTGSSFRCSGRDSSGAVHVRAGQRGTLAAREGAVATIPVYVVQAADGSTATRVVEQLVEDEHRQILTDADRVAAGQHLTLKG